MNDIMEYVSRLREEHGSGSPFALCEALHIKVIYCELPHELNGFYLLIGEAQVIFLNQELSECDARVVCGHELGHALLHKNYNSVFLSTQTLLNCRRYENEADIFCACLLIDDEQYADFDVITLESIAQSAGIPLRLVQLRDTLKQNKKQGAE